MKLDRLLPLMSFALVLVAVGPLIMSGEIASEVWLAFGGAVAGAVWSHGRPWAKSVRITITVALIITFPVLALLSLQSGQWLVNALTFLLLATAVRLMQLLSARHTFQLVVLSFLVMLGSAVTNPGLSFGLFFLVYTMLLTWTLTAAHLRQKVEEARNPEAARIKVQRVFTRRFMLASSTLALGLLLASLGLFLFFPRLGLGFFSAQARAPLHMSGFSDSIELGHYGTIKDSSRVVLRLEFGEGERLPVPLRLRGVSFNAYHQGKWQKAGAKVFPLSPSDKGYYRTRWVLTHKDIAFRAVEYQVYQEPMATMTKVLFGLPRVWTIKPLMGRFDRLLGANTILAQDSMSDITCATAPGTSIAYRMQSVLLDPTPDQLRSLAGPTPSRILQTYLQLPPDLDPRVGDLARSHTLGLTNTYDRAAAIEAFLKGSFTYSTTSTYTGEGDPLSWFLFESRSGHCEYYATAMVLMLRALGVPARPINGFLGGSKSDLGNFVLVTEGHAHSWVEVFFPTLGWVTFDPTPPSGVAEAELSLYGTMSLWTDYMRLQWYKWIIEYDLEKQINLYTGLWNILASRDAQLSLDSSRSPYRLHGELKKVKEELFSARTGLILLAVLLLPGLGVWALRLWRGRGRRPSDLDRLAGEVRRKLRRRGLAVRPGSTLHDLLGQARARGFDDLGELDRLVGLLERARWSGRAVGGGLIRELRGMVRGLR